MDQRPSFSVEVTEHCVKVTGELDILSTPEMTEAVLASSSAELDLRGVTFIDSSGLGALMTLRRNNNGHRRISIIPSPAVASVLAISGTEDEFNITEAS